ncbi:TonB-dependent receptor family protein [Rhodohalobacter halophilus]|uniref:TonB-dependent receptor family protein n=1 Tax=Rhodohalobacter halophilus TaxID=1812810 RepID=UPI00083F6F96|nr:TonB-dependent receptor [Rhodohalobacter halophilus]
MKTNYRYGISSILLLIFFFTVNISSVQARQDVPDSLQVDLDEIVVESTYSSITIDRAPLSVSYRLRNPHDIASRPAATMDELTFALPGVFISNRENYALGERMTIRGLGWRSQFGVRGVQVILDDMPLTVADGQTIMNMIDPAMVHRVELLRGPSATFWGNSSGGVLHVSTRPRTDSPTVQYRGYGGSYSTIKQELRLNTKVGDAAVYGYGSYFETDGFRDHSAARLYRVGLNVEKPLGIRSRLIVRSAFTSMPKAQHPGALTAEDAESDPTAATPNFVANSAGKNFDQGMISASFVQEQMRGVWDITSHFTYRDLENPLPFGFISLERLAGGVRSTYEFTTLPYDLNVGGEFKFQQDDRLETNNVNGNPGTEVDVRQQEVVTNGALFARIAVPLNEKLTASAGLRTDWLHFTTDDEIGADQEGSRTFFSLNPSAGLSYRFDQARWFMNFSTSFESPTTTELVNRPEGGNGFNQNVDPERSISLETGIQGQNSRFSYDFTVFAMQVRDLLLPFQLESDGPTFFRNEGNTRHYGLETTAGFQITPSLQIDGMLTILNATFNNEEFDGNELPGVAPVRIGSILTFTPGKQSFSIDAERIGSYYTDNENSTKNDAYGLLNFRWSANLDQLFNGVTIQPFIAIRNLLNTRHNSSVGINAFGGRYFEPGPDRNFHAGLQLNFN